jgi:hypothetical protein
METLYRLSYWGSDVEGYICASDDSESLLSPP